MGVHDDVLIVGGGANFATPVWDNPKQWHSQLYALDLRSQPLSWQPAGKLMSPLAYSACVSTPHGIAVIGGNDDKHTKAECWLLKVRRDQSNPSGGSRVAVDMQRLADLPQPLVYGQAAWIGNRLIVLSGQTGAELSTAIAGGWQLSISQLDPLVKSRWEPLTDCPGGARAFAMLSVSPKAGGENKLLLLGGRRQAKDKVEFLSDTWQYDAAARSWQQLAGMPVPVTAGGAGPISDQYVAVVSGDDGSLFTQTEQLKDSHPGFAKRTWLFNVANNQWHSGGASPANQVTTTPVMLGQRMLLISGEIRPRVRTNKAWEITLSGQTKD